MSPLLAAVLVATAVATSLPTPFAASPASGAAEQPRDGATEALGCRCPKKPMEGELPSATPLPSPR